MSKLGVDHFFNIKLIEIIINVESLKDFFVVFLLSFAIWECG